jgi:predicted dehydrogenase
MTNPLQVGVIGLGPLWHKRYRPALQALPGSFRVVALCDPVEHQAAVEARRLDCRVTSGPTDLLENDEVEAVLLLDPPWYRLWPLHIACRLGKPVFTCRALDLDDAHADHLCRQVQEHRLPVMVELAPRAAPAWQRVRQLLESPLGPCRVLLGEADEPAQGGTGFGGLAALLDCCASLVPGDPANVLAATNSPGTFISLLMEFTEDRVVHISRCRHTGGRGTLHLRVIAKHGTATVHFPNRVHWTDAEGNHGHILPMPGPLGQTLLEEFYQVARTRQAPTPSWLDACRLLGWLRAADQSRAEGRRKVITDH